MLISWGVFCKFLLFLSLNMVRGGLIKYTVSQNEGNCTVVHR